MTYKRAFCYSNTRRCFRFRGQRHENDIIPRRKGRIEIGQESDQMAITRKGPKH